MGNYVLYLLRHCGYSNLAEFFFLNTMVPLLLGWKNQTYSSWALENICYLKRCGFANCASLKPETWLCSWYFDRTAIKDTNARKSKTTVYWPDLIDSKPRRHCTIVKRIENPFWDKLLHNSSTKLKCFPLFRLFRKNRMIIFGIGIEAIFRELWKI